MIRRSIYGLAIAMLVITTGCLGGSSPATPTTRASANPTPTTGTQTTSTSELQVSYPDGFNSSGYTDPTVAIKSHLQRLRSNSFTSETTMRGPDTSRTITIKASPEQKRASMVIKRNGNVQTEYFFVDGVRYERSHGNTVSYSRESMKYRVAIAYDGQFEGILGSSLSNASVTTDDGKTVITYPIADSQPDDDWRVRGNLTVTGTGLFKKYVIRKSGGGKTGVISYRLTQVGETTVEKPDWLHEAKEQTS